jgi:PAS domain S-box-containing protein
VTTPGVASNSGEDRFHALIQHSSDMIGVLDAWGTITYVSPSTTRWLGYSPRDLIGRSTLELLHPDDLERVRALFVELVKRPGYSFSAEYRIHHADGTWRWVESTNTNLMQEPSVLGLVVNCHDISGRKEAEDALRQSEARARLLASSAFEGLAVHAEGKHVDVNEAFAAMFDYDRHELIGLSPYALAAPESKAIIQEHMRSGSEEPYEVVGIRKDGMRIDLEIRGRTLHDNGRELRVAAIRDVTDRKRAEAALREKEAQYRGIFEATTDGLLLVDLDTGRVAEANPAACHMLGYDYEELVGCAARSIVHRDSYELLAECLRAIEAGGEFRGRLATVRQDGSSCPVELVGKCFAFQGRSHALAIIRDITEQVERERLLEQRVEERTRELSALYRADETLYRSLYLHDILQALVHQAVSLLAADKATVLVWDAAHERLVPGASYGFREEIVARMSHAAGQGITAEVARIGMPIAVEDARADPRVAHHITEPEGIRSLLHVPITVAGEVFGVFGVNYCEPHRFTGREERLLTALAQRAALAINNARLYEQAEGKAALEERQKLARELHDSVSQSLYGIALGARTARTLLERDPSRLAEPLDYVLGLAEAGLVEMRALIFELRPEALAEEGLVPALRKQFASISASYQIPVAVRIDMEEPNVPLGHKEALYRVGREALHNITKHAQAGRVEARLFTTADGLLVLEVHDDGKGFDPSAGFPGHLGLRSMRERMERIGGNLAIESSAARGTLVRATVSLAPLNGGLERSS